MSITFQQGTKQQTTKRRKFLNLAWHSTEQHVYFIVWGPEFISQTKYILQYFLRVFLTSSKEMSLHEEREKSNKMQILDAYYQLLSQHVSAIILPILRRTKTVLLHMVGCEHCSHLTMQSPTIATNHILQGSAPQPLPTTSYKAAPHNRYQPHPIEPVQYTKYSNTVFDLLKMGIMMPETYWDRS